MAHTANRGRSHTTQHWSLEISGPEKGPGRRWPADLSPGCFRVARAAEVSAENGHSLGRRGEGGRLGHPKGGKAGRGNTDTFHRDRDTGKHIVPTNKCNTPHMDTAYN